MMGESSVCLESKDVWVFGSFRPFFQNFSNISNIMKNSLNEPKTQTCLLPRHTQLSPIILRSQVRLFSDQNRPYCRLFTKTPDWNWSVSYKCWTVATPYSAEGSRTHHRTGHVDAPRQVMDACMIEQIIPKP